MQIGELSERSGFSRDAIRFYEKTGIIKIGKRDRQVNNYKIYPSSVLEKLLALKKLKGFGFTLQESSILMAMMEEKQASCKQVTSFVHQKITSIEQKIMALEDIKQRLITGVNMCLHDVEKIGKENCDMILP